MDAIKRFKIVWSLQNGKSSAFARLKTGLGKLALFTRSAALVGCMFGKVAWRGGATNANAVANIVDLFRHTPLKHQRNLVTQRKQDATS